MAFSNNTYVSSPSTKPAEENYSDKGYTLVVPKGCADTYSCRTNGLNSPLRRSRIGSHRRHRNPERCTRLCKRQCYCRRRSCCRDTSIGNRSQRIYRSECSCRRFDAFPDNRTKRSVPRKSRNLRIQSDTLIVFSL